MERGPGGGVDQTRFRDIYRRHAPVVHRRALQLLRQEEDALDVVHDVFERWLDGRAPEASDDGLLAWMYRVTTNLCLNRLRDARRRAALLALHAGHVPVGGLAVTTERVEAARTVAQLAAEATDKELAAAVYCHVDGMTQEEAAEVLGVTSRTIRNLLRRFEDHVRAAERTVAGAGGPT